MYILPGGEGCQKRKAAIVRARRVYLLKHCSLAIGPLLFWKGCQYKGPRACRSSHLRLTKSVLACRLQG